jgi:SOS response regulatory protein OraA/RecX
MARSTKATRRIEALRATARDPNLVEVRVGARTVATLPRSRADELRLREGAAWTPALAARVEHAGAVELAREAALGFLAKRSWSAAGLAARVERGGHAVEAAREAVSALVADGWLDDRAYALDRAERLQRRGSRSEEALQATLEAEGVAPRLARAVARESAPGPAELRAEARAARASREPARRVAARFARRGFDADTIRGALQGAGYDVDE